MVAKARLCALWASMRDLCIGVILYTCYFHAFMVSEPSSWMGKKEMAVDEPPVQEFAGKLRHIKIGDKSTCMPVECISE